jgi:hypothetical protein
VLWGRAAIAAALFTVAACNSATAGQPKPTPSDSQPPPTMMTSKAPDYSLARLCELLSPEEAQELGGSAEGEEGNSLRDGHPICTWVDETSLHVGFQEGHRSADVDTGPSITNTSIKIDGLPAVQSLNTDTVVSCDVLVDLPSGRLVHATAGTLSAGEGKYDPCDLASRLANLIIPRVRNQ